MSDQTTALIITSLLPVDMNNDKPAIAKEIETELHIGTNIRSLKQILNCVADELQNNASTIKRDLTVMLQEEFKNAYGVADLDRVYNVIDKYFLETYGISK